MQLFASAITTLTVLSVHFPPEAQITTITAFSTTQTEELYTEIVSKVRRALEWRDTDHTGGIKVKMIKTNWIDASQRTFEVNPTIFANGHQCSYEIEVNVSRNIMDPFYK